MPARKESRRLSPEALSTRACLPRRIRIWLLALARSPVMPSVAPRIDTDLLRQRHPIVDVIAEYGIELRRSGAAFSGRCPFHLDRGRPNLTAYPRSGRYVCFRCGAHGDAIDFVRQLEQVSFREAVARLDGQAIRTAESHRRTPTARKT